MSITLTEKAASEVKRIIQEGVSSGTLPEKLYLRLRVVGGGCSGFQHKLDLDPEVKENLDEVFEFHGVPVVIDKRSLMYLAGARVDFHDDLNRRGFSIENPSAKSTCGCGSSFSM
jgi:iron-sulfur cluster assembly protein